MSDKEQPKKEQEQEQKLDTLNFNFQDILGDDVNTSSSSFQAIPNFDNQDNQSASYNNLPAELQHLFSDKSTDDLLKESNASPIQAHPLLWNNNGNTSNNTTPFVTPSPMHDSSKPSSNSQSVLSSSPMSQNNSPQVQPQSSPEISSPQVNNRPIQSSPTMNLQHSPQITAQSPKIAMHGSPQINAQSPHHSVQLSRSNSQHSPVVQHSPIVGHQSPLSHSQPLPQHSPLLNSQSPRVNPHQPQPQQQQPQQQQQQMPGNTVHHNSPQIMHSSPQALPQALPQQSPRQSPQQQPQQPMPMQQQQHHQPAQIQPQPPQIQQKKPIKPQNKEPAVQNSPQPITQSPHQLHQSPMVAPQMMPDQNAQRPPPPGNPPTPGGSGGPTHLTLLDNLTSQLPPDRRDSFFRLFRQLQNNEVTANQFLEQAKMLLDQQQYQQLENLKSRPVTAPPLPNMSPAPVNIGTSSPRYIPVRPPIQPQQPQQPQPIPQQAFKNKRTMSSSQLRAEDTQRALSGLITPQAKRSRLSDIPSSPQALPMYRPNPPQQMQPQMQHIQMQPQQQQHPQIAQSPQQQQFHHPQQMQHQHQMQHQQQMHQQMQQQQQQQQQQQMQQPQQLQQPQQQQQQQQQSNGQMNYENYNAVNEEEANKISQSFMNAEMLTDLLNKIAITSDINNVGKDVVTFIALATQSRIKELIHHMIYASKHRVDSQEFIQPPSHDNGSIPYKIADIQDVKKQLLAIERVEREEERKRKEIIVERERRAQMGEGENGENGDDERPSKKKKKKELGPGLTARHMSEGARKKNTDETALMIAGGVKKSWMLTGIQAKEAAAAMNASRQNSASVPPPPASPLLTAQSSNTPISASPTNTFSPFSENAPSPSSTTAAPPNTSAASVANAAAVATSAAAQAQAAAQATTVGSPAAGVEDQPRGRGRPRRRKSGSGPDLLTKKDRSKSTFIGGGGGGGVRGPDNRFFLPPSTIGRPHRLGEQGSRKITVRDALFVLEDECVNKKEKPQQTLLKAYSLYLK